MKYIDVLYMLGFYSVPEAMNMSSLELSFFYIIDDG